MDLTTVNVIQQAQAIWYCYQNQLRPSSIHLYQRSMIMYALRVETKSVARLSVPAGSAAENYDQSLYLLF